MRKLTTKEILPLLENVKKSNNGYTAKCPLHDDNNNSFSICDNENGVAICNCFAGCQQSALWDYFNSKLQQNDSSGQTAKKRTKNKVIAEYEYKDQDGATVDVKRRYDNKGFSWKRGTAKRAEILPLYNLEDILTAVDVFAVEGEKDVNTLKGLGYPATSTKDGFTPENMHYLQGKNVYVIEDNDTPGRKTAKKAATMAKAAAKHVKIVDLSSFFPALPVKGDITDFIEMHGNIDELTAYITTLPDFIPDDNETEDEKHPHAAIYENIEHYFISKKGVLTYSNGDNITPVCFGSLIITEEITKYNGVDSEIYFTVEGVSLSGETLPRQTVSAADFSSLNWIIKCFGSAIVAAPTQSAKQKLLAAITLTGQQAVKRQVYTHTGYIMKDKKPLAYIHGRGAIGLQNVICDLDYNLQRYKMTEPATDNKKAIRASLDLIQAHELNVTYPCLAFTYLPPLMPIVEKITQEAGFLLYLQGKTQSGKSTLAALICSHYGCFTSMTPPASFTATANALNELAFILKNSILWVDDFHPQGKKDKDKQSAVFNSLARSAGDHATRARLNANATLKHNHAPRCLFLATGETEPDLTQSGYARIFTINTNYSRSDITEIQANAKSGLLSQATAGYIDFIINNYSRVCDLTEKIYNDCLTECNNIFGVCRLSCQCALLLTSLKVFTIYVNISGVLDETESKNLFASGKKHILRAADNIEKQINNSDPVNLYIQSLSEILSSGQRFALDLTKRDRDSLSLALGTTGDFIAWCDPDFYYLEPTMCYHAVSEYLYKSDKTFNYSRQALQRELFEKGLVIGDPDKQTATSVKTIGGKSVRVLKMKRGVIDKAIEYTAKNSKGGETQ